MASILGTSQVVDVCPMTLDWCSLILRLQVSPDMDPRSMSPLYHLIAPPLEHDMFMK